MTRKNTKELILDAAEELFLTKGFDQTSMSDIQEKTGIARGTLYYHFESKEKIMDGVIARESEKIVGQTQEIAQDKSKPALTRLDLALKTLNQNSENQDMMDHLHQPQNALMHEKVNQTILDEVAPLLAEIIEDGNEEGVFSSSYTLDTVEMLVLYANYSFDYSFNQLEETVQTRKKEAFLHNLKILLGVNFDPDDLFPRQGDLHGK